jgi:hypothetical protein
MPARPRGMRGRSVSGDLRLGPKGGVDRSGTIGTAPRLRELVWQQMSSAEGIHGCGPHHASRFGCLGETLSAATTAGFVRGFDRGARRVGWRPASSSRASWLPAMC